MLTRRMLRSFAKIGVRPQLSLVAIIAILPLLAVLLFGEAFTLIQMAGFGCAWLAVAMYTTDSLVLLHGQRNQAALAAAAPAAEPS